MWIFVLDHVPKLGVKASRDTLGVVLLAADLGKELTPEQRKERTTPEAKEITLGAALRQHQHAE